MTEHHDHRDDCPFKFATLDVCDCVEKNMLDRIEALTKERDQHWDSFVHWRKQADDLTGQLAAARRDAEEAEAYAMEVEAENKMLRDAVFIDDLTVTMQARDRSKAAAGIGRAFGFLDANMPQEAKAALRTALAELTGGKDD